MLSGHPSHKPLNLVRIYVWLIIWWNLTLTNRQHSYLVILLMKNTKCLLVMKEGTLWTEKGREKFFVDKNTCILFYQWWCMVKSLRSEMRQSHAKTRWSKLSIINDCIGKNAKINSQFLLLCYLVVLWPSGSLLYCSVQLLHKAAAQHQNLASILSKFMYGRYHCVNPQFLSLLLTL